MRPLRGGQGTFDKIIKNIRQVAGKVPDLDRRQLRRVVGRQLSGAARLPARAGVRRQAREGRVQADHPRAEAAAAPKGFIPLTVVGDGGKPLNGTCMTSAGAGRRPATSVCDTCHFLDEKMSFLREETKKRGFPTVDGVHMGPCEIHKQHAHTIGPDGSLYACPGFAGDVAAVDRPHRRPPGRAARTRRGERFDEDRGVEGVRRLRVHPGLRGRLLGRRAHRARRHEQAELPQDELRGGRRSRSRATPPSSAMASVN